MAKPIFKASELEELLSRRQKVRTQLKKLADKKLLDIAVVQLAFNIPDSVLLTRVELIHHLNLENIKEFSPMYLDSYIRRGKLQEPYPYNHKLAQIGEQAEILVKLCKDGLKLPKQ